jgi:actin, other eukaryote
LTSVVPVAEGNIFPHAILSMEVGGEILTDFLSNNLITNGFKFKSLSEKETVDKIKISECLVSNKPIDHEPEVEVHTKRDRKEKKKEIDENDDLLKQYVLPDGQKITLSYQRVLVPEILFNPSIVGLDITGAHEKIHESIFLCNIDVRKDLFSNILLLGGSTQFPNFKKRLDNELDKKAPEKIKVKTSTTKNPRITSNLLINNRLDWWFHLFYFEFFS